MERKTMGGLIAALRKANGMTQKDLAEKLNVSDKSVSRWERNDGAPDLALIPVIAEVFGVTCDELLRGERRPPETAPAEKEPDTKTPRLRQHLLAASLLRYKNKTMIAVGLAIGGLLAAAVANFGFNRAYIALFTALAFYLAAGVAQVIFLNQAFFAVEGEEDAGTFKKDVIRGAERCFTLLAALVTFTLPLGIVGSAYYGLSLESWLVIGLLLSAAVLLLAALVCYKVNVRLLDKAAYTLPEKQEQSYRHNARLADRCTKVFLAVLAFTVLIHALATGGWNPRALVQGTTFDDWESFVEFMEQDAPTAPFAEGQPIAPEPDSTIMNAEEWKQQEDELRRHTITDNEGNVLCEFIWRNSDVTGYSFTDHGPPITLHKSSDYQQGQIKLNRTNLVFAAVYLAELAAAVLAYALRKQKLPD